MRRPDPTPPGLRDRADPLMLTAPIVLLQLLVLAGCGDASVAPRVPTTVEVTPEEATVEIDQSQAFAARVLDEAGEPIEGLEVVWSTVDAGVAVITGAGTAYARAAGATTVIATAEGLRGEAALDVVPPVPSPPSELTAHRVGPHRIQLHWMVSRSYESRFEIERHAPGETEFTALQEVAGDRATYVDAAATTEGEYLYRVRACNASGCSTRSPEAAASTPPATPTDLTITGATATTLTLTWTDNSSLELRTVVERASGQGGFVEIAELTPDVSTFTDEGLEPGTEYRYRVRSCDDAGCSAYSAEATGATLNLPAPEAPTETAAWLLVGQYVVLTWADNSTTESSFRIDRAENAGTFSLLTMVGSDVESYSDEAITPDTPYRYRVQACNPAGCSAFSAETFIASLPVAPTDAVATATGETTVDLSWTDASRTETEFRIERKRTETGEFAQIAVAGTDTESYSDSGLDRDVEYAYRVRACNASGCSAYSPERTVTTPVTTPPTAPTGTSALVAVLDDGPIISVDWVDNSDIETGFELWRQDPAAAYALIATVDANGTSYQDDTVLMETEYGYKVRACGIAGCSEFGAEVRPHTPPIAPSDLVATPVSSSQVDLAWTDHSEKEARYELQRAIGTGSFDPVVTFVLDADQTSFSDVGLDPDTAYQYRVRACGDIGCSSYSAIAGAVTGP